MECGNCYTCSSSQWRKIENILYCNAFGIYFKRNGYHKNGVEYYASILMKLK